MRSHFLHGPHGRLLVRESTGTGADVILIHGNSLHSGTFAPQFEGEPGRRLHLVAFDLPGRGGSERSEDPIKGYGLAAYIAALEFVMKELKLREPIVLGHSLGGHLAVQAAARGVRLGPLFLIAAPPLRSVETMARAFKPSGALQALFDGTVSPETAELVARAMVHNYSLYGAMIRDAMTSTDPAARTALAESIAREGLADELSTVRTHAFPTMHVVGELDEIIDRAHYQVPATTVTDAGHAVQLDAPHVVNALFTSFAEA